MRHATAGWNCSCPAAACCAVAPRRQRPVQQGEYAAIWGGPATHRPVVQQSLANTLKLICLETRLTKREVNIMNAAQTELANVVDEMVRSMRSARGPPITSQAQMNAAIAEAIPVSLPQAAAIPMTQSTTGTQTFKWNPPEVLGDQCPSSPPMRRLPSPPCSYCNKTFSGHWCVDGCRWY